MLRLLLCGWLALAVPSLGAQEGPKESIKSAGRAVGEAGVKVGHTVRDGAVAAKEGVKKAGRAVGHGAKKVAEGVRDGVKAVGEGVKEAIKKD
jgi:hypothetical protein